MAGLDFFSMTTLWSAMIGVFLGFVFGVGCALAVMYSIYTGGYMAAIRDGKLDVPPDRYYKAIARATAKLSAGR